MFRNKMHHRPDHPTRFIQRSLFKTWQIRLEIQLNWFWHLILQTLAQQWCSETARWKNQEVCTRFGKKKKSELWTKGEGEAKLLQNKMFRAEKCHFKLWISLLPFLLLLSDLFILKWGKHRSKVMSISFSFCLSYFCTNRDGSVKVEAAFWDFLNEV